LPTGASTELVNNRLGSGSDYTVFLNYLGVPVADLTFDGPYGVYHSMYDNHNWVARIGDPGFRYHVSLVQMWGLIAMRLANADAIPLDYEPYAAEIQRFVKEVEGRRPELSGDRFADVRAAAGRLEQAAAAFNRRRTEALARGDQAGLDQVNRQVLLVERAFLDPAGIPGRPWYRHQIYAPKFTYAPEVLPGVAEAIEANDAVRLTAQAARLSAALLRAAAALQ
jgi:N-acetylated-alpha-linked acidic dipeptidase